MFGLRKKTKKVKESKYKHYLKICCFEGCYSVTKNPGEHLRSRKHGMKIDDPDYKTLVRSFKRYDPSLLKNIEITESPKKAYGVIEKKKSKTRNTMCSALPFVPEEENIDNSDNNDSDTNETEHNNETENNLPIIEALDESVNGESEENEESEENTQSCHLGPKVNKLVDDFYTYMIGPDR